MKAFLLKNSPKIEILRHFYIRNMLTEAKISCLVEMTVIYKNPEFLLPCLIENWPFLTFCYFVALTYYRLKPYEDCNLNTI